MLTLQQITENKKQLLASLEKRNYPGDHKTIVDELIDLDARRKQVQTHLDESLGKINNLSRDIGYLYKNGKRDRAEDLKAEVAAIKQTTKIEEENLKSIKLQLREQLLNLPNIAHKSVKPGKGDTENEIVKNPFTLNPEKHSKTLPHWELSEQYGLIDFKTGAKITGSGFPLYTGLGAKFQRSLISFFLDRAAAAGYTEMIPPLLVNEDSARGTGQLPDKEGQMYWVEKDNLYLIPTAEVPITNIFRDSILREEEFPIKMVGYTPCFRREAGSYGSDVKGLNRLHQFDKVEIVQIQHPEHSYETLDEMIEYVEGLLNQLELPYRIMRLCGGDLGFASAMTYDFEVYSPGQDKWLEVSSVSNFETFQSHRLKLRFKNAHGKTRLAHTLNGSALALPRIVAALLEKNQTENGILIPESLRNYTGFEIIQ